MFSRAGRAALLKRTAFTEAFFDSNATADAALIVASVAAAGYGLGYLTGLVQTGSLPSVSVFGLLQAVIAGVVSWLILGFATWFAANKLFGATGRPQTLLGLQGLAVLPLLLEFVTAIGAVVGLVWYLVVLVVATREGTDLDTRSSVAAVLIGFAVAAIIRLLMGLPFAAFNALFS